ncbi:MAG: UbiD family decarboxylase [Thermodesulfobacteriota bacterium]
MGEERSFAGSMREWITLLEKEGHLNRVRVPVHWDQELGAVVRRTYDFYGDASPALLFESIVDYPPPGPHRVFVGQFRSYSRICLMLGLDPVATSRREIVLTLKDRLKHSLPPVETGHGPVHENVDTGDHIDVLKFPVPFWNYRDGGRYIGTMHAVITRDLDSGWINAGLYRIMVHNDKELGIYMRPGRQHIGQQYLRYIEKGKPMPVAIAIGVDPSLALLSSANVPSGVNEYEIAGAVRGVPIETVKGKTVDLPVPADSEIVIEGYIDPAERKTEGPFGEYPGYYGEVPGPSPVIRVTAVTYRNDPILQGSIEGHPINESHIMSSVMKSATIWDQLERNGVPGVRSVACIPESSNCHIVVSITPTVPAHADWIASAIWGTSAAVWLFKHVFVVDDDIDPWDLGQVNWAMAWRVKASEDIKIWKNHRGSPIDPRQEPEAKGFWDRVLIDATRPFNWKPREIWGSEGVNKGVPLSFPPTTRPSDKMIRAVNQKWGQYGISPVTRFIGNPVGIMRNWWDGKTTDR